MPYKYIGRTTDFCGKSLWEIVGNLKNYGVGRYVVRNVFMKRYPEPSFMKIVKVETLPCPQEQSMDFPRKVKVWLEKVFRGRSYPELECIEATSYKTDYQLIPKDEEEKYRSYKAEPAVKNIMPRTKQFPPLMLELIYRDAEIKGEVFKEEPKLKIVYREGRENNYRIAEEGETPNVEVPSGLGTPASPNLYEGIKL